MGLFKFKKKQSDLPDLSLDSLPNDDLDKDLFGGNPPSGVLDHKDDLSMGLDMPPPPPGTAQVPSAQPFDFSFSEEKKEPVKDELSMPDFELPPELPLEEPPAAAPVVESPKVSVPESAPQIIQVSKPQIKPVVKIETRSEKPATSQVIGPLYLRLDAFGNIMSEFSQLTDLFSTVKSHENNLDGLNRKQEHLFGRWHVTIEELQKKLDEVESILFTG